MNIFQTTILGIAFILLLVAGCVQEKPIGGDTDEHGCMVAAGYSWCETKQKCLREWEEPCVARFTLEQARAIALGSSCIANGNLTGEYGYDNATSTWSFATDIVKAGCNPRCVMDEMTASAGIDWTCTWDAPSEELSKDDCPGGDGSTLTRSEALKIAGLSNCTDEGNLTTEAACDAGTWWVRIVPFEAKPDCDAFCVVGVETNAARIKWRCAQTLE